MRASLRIQDNVDQCVTYSFNFYNNKKTASNHLSSHRLKLLLSNSASVTLQLELEAVVWEQRVLSPENEGWGEGALSSSAISCLVL